MNLFLKNVNFILQKIWIAAFSNVNITNMEQYLYSILDEHDNVIASDMTMDTALILLKALFMEYYNEPDISYQIVRKSNITSEG